MSEKRLTRVERIFEHENIPMIHRKGNIMKVRKKIRRYLAGALSAVMLLTSGSLIAFAEDTEPGSAGEAAVQETDEKTLPAADAENEDAQESGETETQDAEKPKSGTADGTQTDGEKSEEEDNKGQGASALSEQEEAGADSANALPAAGALAAPGENNRIIDLENNNITSTYNSLKNSYSGDLDITWKRSSENDAYRYNGKVTDYPWDWEDVKDIDLSITNENRVWDGSRLSGNSVSHYYSASDYLSSNMVSALDGTLYDSATWEQLDSGNKTSVYRFQGTFSIGNDNPNNFDYTLRQVTGAGEKNRIYINDNMFVFVYPQGTVLTNDTYKDYLAFWTGTVGGDGETASFHDRESTEAHWDARRVGNSNIPNTALGRVTNGWYCDAVTDNIGNYIYNAYNTNGTKNFVIDVFVEDFAAGGGMYRLQVDKTKTTRHNIEFKKVDETTLQPVAGAEFKLVSDKGTQYTAVSDANGSVKFSAPAGTYTMSETRVPSNYEENTKTWTVNIRSDGSFTITGADKKEFDGTEYYYITNKAKVSGSLSFDKKKSDGSALAGAVFTLYESDGKTAVASGTSGADGKVSISGIPVGTGYVLKETSSPDGYAVSKDTWTVDVSSTGATTMYLSSDTGKTSVTEVVNYTEGEEALRGLEKSKTVTSEEEAERVFKVLLNAYSTGSTTSSGMSDIDVMFVLDKSTSMANYDRDEHLESAVRSFLNQMIAEKEKGNLANSRIAIVEFSGSVSDRTNGWVKDIDGTQGLQYWANNYSLNMPYRGDGTSMAAGLKKAYDSYYSGSHGYNSNNKQIVITLTDGDNNRNENGDTDRGDYDQDALDQAAKIRTKVSGITFYGIGLGIPENKTGIRAFMSSLIGDSTKLWYVDDTSGGEALSQVFTDIFYSSVTSDVYEDARVVDYIDSRFQYAYKEGNTWKVYTDKQVQDAGAGGISVAGGTLKYDSVKKCQYIEWTQDIGEKDGNKEFEKTFYIKAKDDFVGGNMIPTNGDGSGIWINKDTISEFEKPTANVKLLSLGALDETKTVFIKDVITPSELMKELDDNFTITGLNDETYEVPADCMLTSTEIVGLVQGGSVEKVYKYGDTNDAVGVFTYQFEVVKGNKAQHEADQTGYQAEDYRITVTYTPYTEGEREEILEGSYTDPAGKENTQAKTADADYFVNVVSGQIDITKLLAEGTDRDPVLEGDAIFTFKIACTYATAGGSSETLYRTVRLDGSADQAAAEALSDLPRGTYTITELKSQRYNVSAMSGDGTYDSAAKAFTVTFGEADIPTVIEDDDDTVITKAVKITNTKTADTGKRTDTDVVLNRYEWDDSLNGGRGGYKITQITVPQDPENE